MRTSQTLCILSICFFLFTGAQAQGITGKSIAINKSYPDSNVDGYMLYLPKSYDLNKKQYPILVFLQGSGGVGGEVHAVNAGEIPKMVAEETDMSRVRNQYVLDSFIVVCPHIDEGQYFEEETVMRQILDEVVEQHRADASRIYLTGLSRGGMGSWGLAETMSDVFAAVVPIAGGVWMVEDYTPMIDLPIWIGHAIGDSNLEFPPIEEAAKKIEALGGDAFFRMNTAIPFNEDYLSHTHIFSAFERDIHNVWDDMYDSIQLYKWLLKQKK